MVRTPSIPSTPTVGATAAFALAAFTAALVLKQGRWHGSALGIPSIRPRASILTRAPVYPDVRGPRELSPLCPPTVEPKRSSHHRSPVYETDLPRRRETYRPRGAPANLASSPPAIAVRAPCAPLTPAFAPD